MSVRARSSLPPIALLLGVACSSDQEVHPLSPALVVAPASLDFGEVAVDYAQQAWIEVINDGRATLEVQSVTFGEGTGAVFTKDASSLQVGAGERVPLNLACTPTTYTDYAGTLVLASNDPDRPILEIPLTCTGVHAPTPDIDLDPMTLDFGSVDPGDSVILWTTLSNRGDDDLHITSTTQAGSGNFVLASDPEGATLTAGGDEVLLVFTYEPATILGDNGTLLILSDDPDEPAVSVTLLGNGGGDYDYPVAVIDGPTESLPLETVSLDGSGSYDPNGYDLTFDWALAEAPEGSRAELAGTGDEVSLFLDVAGDYEIELAVVNEIGVRSAPAEHTIHVVPTDRIHVEMFWDSPNSDVDLHLLQAGTPLFAEPTDCNFCNPTPDWGRSGESADDPTLDLDDISGYGPENINIEDPAEGEYEIWVHYFEDLGNGAVAATARVWLEGEIAYEATEVLEHDQRWYVGSILWPEALVAENEDVPIEDGGRRNCYEP